MRDLFYIVYKEKHLIRLGNNCYYKHFISIFLHYPCGYYRKQRKKHACLAGYVFRGSRIPKWDLIVKTCCEAAKMIDNPVTGWDVTINSNLSKLITLKIWI